MLFLFLHPTARYNAIIQGPQQTDRLVLMLYNCLTHIIEYIVNTQFTISFDLFDFVIRCIKVCRWVSVCIISRR